MTTKSTSYFLDVLSSVQKTAITIDVTSLSYAMHFSFKYIKTLHVCLKCYIMDYTEMHFKGVLLQAEGM